MSDKDIGSVYLTCASCGATLTGPVEWSEFSAFDPDVVDGQSPVQRGTIVRWNMNSTAPIYFGDGKSEGLKVYSRSGAISMHPDDVIRDQIQSCGFDNGCCGSDGLDGENRACNCGAVLGTEWSDCWTQAEVRLSGDAVEVKRC
ncbi:hypothetical protein [Asticcacaulis sp. AC460]|uniref:hypothetical protein n=1 Tax=Asticcacaulis sp. AC460 TaxID=1282360 RepID=UPI00138B01E6|nr:hypothetical protein [Asticcacaulis sp. AC460]